MQPGAVDPVLPLRRRWTFACGVASGIVFTLGHLLLGAIKGGGYEPLRHPVSSLAIGTDGWLQSLNFAVLSGLLACLAFGYWTNLRAVRGGRAAAVLCWLIALGFAGAAVFTADPLNGFPPGTPVVSMERSPHGLAHDLFSALFFLDFPALCLVFAGLYTRLGRPWPGPLQRVVGVRHVRIVRAHRGGPASDGRPAGLGRPASAAVHHHRDGVVQPDLMVVVAIQRICDRP